MMTRTPTRKFLLSAGALALAAAPALAQAQKETPPAGGPAKAFTVPAHETYALPNGLEVTLVPYGNIPKVSVDLTLRTGGVNEPAGLRGIADFTTDLLKEGTTTLSSQALAEATARMGSSLGAGADDDETILRLDVLSENGPDAVKLLADVLQHPLLPESELARLKSNAVRQITLAKSQPGTIAAERFSKLLYGDHPYGSVIPTEENINKISIDDVRKFYAANYGAARSHLYIAGKFDSAAVKRAIAESFTGWAKGPSIVENAPMPKAQRVLDVTDRPGAPQSTIYVGLPVPGTTSPDNIALTVTNSLLGGSFASRITANIREQKGYTYSPHSVVSRRYHDAYWAEVADVTTAVTGPSLKEIFGEIGRLQAEAPAAAELQGIQSYLSGIFVVQNSTRQALIGQLQFVDLQGLGEDYLKTYVQKINAVTPADVQRIAKQYLKPDEMAIVVVGDKAKITEQLAPFAPATPASK
ncbi:MAG TPA: pitrilysin family protein [Candidatus Saccharimonadales bacterium]|nr:pitrilysin family protein [Candidatus Saccharimonadales bacterium]